jgi:hypothetical protein
MPSGNYWGRRRKNFHLSVDACQMIVDLAQKLGLSESGVLECAVRKLYKKKIGPYPWEPPSQITRVRSSVKK